LPVRTSRRDRGLDLSDHEEFSYVGTLNTQQTLRRTLKPRSGGSPGFPVIIVSSVVGVLLIGGGIGYALETGQKHQPPAAVGLNAIVPPLASFTTVMAVTHVVATAKKPGKHHTAPSTQASPAISPTPGATPSASPASTTAAGKIVATKHVTHHIKQSALTTIAFDPAAATEPSTPDPIPSQAPVQTPVQAAATAPPVAATPELTPIYEPAVVVDARFVSQVQPIYPEIPKSQGIQGTAIVLVTVGPDGNVISLSIGQSTGNRLLDAAALEAARSSKFQAPEVDGHPATETYRIVYTFAL
jgi:TonB family protein